ncbi:DUF4625 domain-containing protein [Niabella hibiscisoli]|uniref:DUF4625 domain-containing protein n=1 Tax=Niabella hibiscisoli TaxID=1825928 RepID=UPI001F0FB01A|nr:DUF4625 domain-containing protein [Niabella hibiscisoli]MCH5714821.1 DUF4625 domain-containing protein [Niabella hibiscisoli]
MKQKQLLTSLLGLLLLIAACSKKDQDAIDTTYPEIDVLTAGAFPKQCSEVQRGQSFTARIHASDNKELGSVSIDIHHNFDHHSHSTEVAGCNMDAVKTPVKPMVLIQTINVPGGQTSYVAEQTIHIPADVDAGDYHFLIRVTDKEGWQTIKGLSIKIK